MSGDKSVVGAGLGPGNGHDAARDCTVPAMWGRHRLRLLPQVRMGCQRSHRAFDTTTWVDAAACSRRAPSARAASPPSLTAGRLDSRPGAAKHGGPVHSHARPRSAGHTSPSATPGRPGKRIGAAGGTGHHGIPASSATQCGTGRGRLPRSRRAPPHGVVGTSRLHPRSKSSLRPDPHADSPRRDA